MKAELTVSVDGNIAFHKKFNKEHKAEEEFWRWYIYARRLTDSEIPQTEERNVRSRYVFFEEDKPDRSGHRCTISLEYCRKS